MPSVTFNASSRNGKFTTGVSTDAPDDHATGAIAELGMLAMLAHAGKGRELISVQGAHVLRWVLDDLLDGEPISVEKIELLGRLATREFGEEAIYPRRTETESE